MSEDPYGSTGAGVGPGAGSGYGTAVYAPVSIGATNENRIFRWDKRKSFGDLREYPHKTKLGMEAGSMGSLTPSGLMTRMEAKEFIKLLFTRVAEYEDRNRLRRWKADFEKYIPVRSGHLSSTILGSLRVERQSYGTSKYWAFCMYDYPLTGYWKRPTFIRNPRQVPPAKGYGQFIGINRTRPPPNVNLLHRTAGGNALYMLNDPYAHEDVRIYMNRVMYEEILDDYATKFDDVIMAVTI